MYYLNLLIIVGLGILLCEIKPQKWKTILYLFICMLSMAALFSFRYGMGYDFYSYKHIFEAIASAPSLSSLFSSVHMKSYPLFTLIVYSVSMFTESYLVLNVVLSATIFGCLGFALYRYSPVPWVSVFCYVTLLHLYVSMNFVRQSMAACVILLAYPFLKQRRIIPYMVFVFVAGCIHFYAFIMAPAYFFLILKPSKKHYAIIGSLWLVIFTFSQEILSFLAGLSPRIKEYISTIYIQVGASIHSSFLLIICLIAILSFSKLLLSKQSQNYVLINSAFYGLLFNLFSLRHSIMERFAHYFTILMILTFAEIAFCLRPQPQLSEKEKQSKLNKREERKQWFNYKWYLASLIVVLLINHAGAEARNDHRVFPYYSVFNEKWRKQIDYIYYEIGNSSWLLREISPLELPEELR